MTISTSQNISATPDIKVSVGNTFGFDSKLEYIVGFAPNGKLLPDANFP